MRKSRKVLVIFLIVGIGAFGYFQYAAATQIGVIVTQSELVEKTDQGSTYNVQLEFDNPSLLILNAGDTDFEITVDNQKVAEGVLDPFVLPALSKVVVDGKYHTNQKGNTINEDNIPPVSITGITKYDIFFTSIDVPFIYLPPEDQAREFIHQN